MFGKPGGLGLGGGLGGAGLGGGTGGGLGMFGSQAGATPGGLFSGEFERPTEECNTSVAGSIRELITSVHTTVPGNSGLHLRF